jgi:MOSC domain-containing protein YiiM
LTLCAKLVAMTTKPTGRITSLQVGAAATYQRREGDESTQWISGIAKDRFVDSIELGTEGVVGDVQVDRVHHGGVDKAVLLYAAAHYATWEPIMGALPWGAFGENISVVGFDEWSVCIGDRFRVGAALTECTQPRQPCWKLSQRWQRPTLAREVQDNSMTGWYLRVLEPGAVSELDSIELVERPHPTFTVARASDVMHRHVGGIDAVRELLAIGALSASWRATMTGRLDDTSSPTAVTDRLDGVD